LLYIDDHGLDIHVIVIPYRRLATSRKCTVSVVAARASLRVEAMVGGPNDVRYPSA
jgi:hypothetical protein